MWYPKFTRMLLAAALATAACTSSSDGGTGATGATGTVQIFVVAEDSIAEGLDPGDGPENIQDGWSVRYNRYLVAVGNFRARRTDTGATIGDPNVYVLDLKNAPENGYVVTELRDVAAVRWDKFGLDIPNAKDGAKAMAPTTQADLDLMVQKGYSVYFEATATKADRSISFKWGFSAGTSFDDCATENGLAGFAVPAGGTVQVKPTLHGDHQYFDNVTQGVEITKRVAQWIDTCDEDRNADLTIEELKRCDVTRAMPTPPYDLSAVRDQDADGRISAFDYVDTQMRTFADYQGDGECPTRTPLR